MFIATGAAFLVLAVVFWLSFPLTTYAPGYTRAGFRKIRVGMKGDEVVQLVGEPFSPRVGEPQGQAWFYSRDAEGNFLHVLGFRESWLVLSNNVVIRVYDWWRFPWSSWDYSE